MFDVKIFQWGCHTLSLFTLSCSTHLLYFLWFQLHLTDAPPKSSFMLNQFMQCSIISDISFSCTSLNFSKFSFLTYLYPVLSGCIQNNFTQRCAIWCYIAPGHLQSKLLHFVVHCITWPNTLLFHLRLTHLTSPWLVLLDSVPFHVRCSVTSSYPISIIVNSALPFHVSLSHLTPL